MKIILRKQPQGSSSGWICQLCGEGLRNWQDAEIHPFLMHNVPREHIATRSDTGDICDLRHVDLDALRTAGMI